MKGLKSIVQAIDKMQGIIVLIQAFLAGFEAFNNKLKESYPNEEK